MSQYTTTKSENKTRKHWLFSTFFILVLYPFIDVAIATLLSISSQNTLAEGIFRSIIRSIIGVIQTIFLWHCAYRNYGTKLLSFYLVALPCLLVIGMSVSLTDLENSDTTTISNSCSAYTIIADLAFLLASLAAFFLWLMLSLKMKNVNRAIHDRNTHGFIPLLKAATAGDIETIELLLKKGVDINAKNNKGENALSIARKYHPELVDWLIAQGAK